MKMAVFARNLRSLIAAHHDGNVSEAARALKINRTQLNRYLMEETWPREAQLRQICAHFSTDARLLMEPLDTINAPAPAVTVHDGIAAIAAERQRQIEVEGWTPGHDDQHQGAELAQAAAAYVLNCCDDSDSPARRFLGADIWPWADEWWKPSGDPRRDLVKAGALIAAEIDRLDRMASRVVSAEGGA
ncbi:helix-turn-helix domain-containing protein [Salipiger manganoxidans]|uniref:helix-turn-helix domain-containing protein n=1 Tax=Salipiger marinus TaxID=555512 RepID=UPI001E5D3572|nr:helix-turn-helix domain-containing protein [Salipiger manganoxidans]MCD1616948.1 helix-turn-helix domain-containing protein [Salipiger manganoxidans]